MVRSTHVEPEFQVINDLKCDLFLRRSLAERNAELPSGRIRGYTTASRTSSQGNALDPHQRILPVASSADQIDSLGHTCRLAENNRRSPIGSTIIHALIHLSRIHTMERCEILCQSMQAAAKERVAAVEVGYGAVETAERHSAARLVSDTPP
jgi:hypothetical protein